MPIAIVIHYSREWDEYQVPAGNGSMYHTDDKADAIATAKHIHGQDVEIRIVRGK